MLLDASRPEQTPSDGPATWSSSYLLGCDAEGSLYGKVILVGDTLPDTPVDCPEEVTPEPTAASKVTAVTTFVGSDDYPARITCAYDTTEPCWCGADELRH